jgi:DNA-binding NarL/FixJ family response regulator
MEPLRILVVDDHDLVRRGVKTILLAHEDWEVCGEANTGQDAIMKAQELKPDIVVLDIGMPDLNGLEVARRIRAASANTEILILSVHQSDQLVREIVKAGANGFIVKSDSDRDLVTAVESLANHKPFFNSQVSRVILGPFNSDGPINKVPVSIRERLTAREREIVQLIVDGQSSKEAASSLGISVKTIETHRVNIMRKLEIHSVIELAHYAIRNQIVEP